LWLEKCGFTVAKIGKIGNFWNKFSPKRYIPLSNFFTKFGVEEGVPGLHDHGKFHALSHLKCGLTAPKIAKIGIFGIGP